MKITWICLFIYFAFVLAQPQAPLAKKVPHNTTIFNVTIEDDYFWIRNRTDPQVISYLEEETQYAQAIFASDQRLHQLKEELYSELKINSITEGIKDSPVIIGNYSYFSQMQNDKAYAFWYRKATWENSIEELILDENELVHNSSVFTLGVLVVSPDQRLLAYSVDRIGNDRFTLYIKNLTSGQILSDEIQDTYYSSVVWSSDSTTLFYNQIDKTAEQALRVYRHRLGTGAESDICMLNNTDLTFDVSVKKSNNEEFIFIYLQGQVTNEVWYLRASEPNQDFEVLYPRMKSVQYFVQPIKDTFYILTNDEGAYNFKVVSVPIADTSKGNWMDILPHREDVFISQIQLYQDHMVVWEIKDTLQQIRVVNLTNLSEFTYVPIPKGWYAIAQQLHPDSPFQYTNFYYKQFSFSYSTLIQPRIFYSFDMYSYELKQIQNEIFANYEISLYATERLEVDVDNGTFIPCTIAYRKDRVSKQQTNPMLLTGYGAYGDIRMPQFDSDLISLLDRGVIFGIAHVRGSGIRGDLWYQNGKMLNKKNTFTDFIACAQYLIDNGYTTSDQLAIHGRSAGGLLMGAVLVMRPDLFKVVWAQVPFVDVIDTMLDSTIPWVTYEFYEWGNPRNEEFFHYMHSYDPYLNIKKTGYPHVIMQSGWKDPIVGYWEPTKFVAKLRALKTDDNIVILDTVNAGHMGATGDDYYADLSFQYAFLLSRILPDEMKYPPHAIDFSGIVTVVVASILVLALVIVWQVVVRLRKKRSNYKKVDLDDRESSEMLEV